ncbi:MAG: membrane dipeptidase [Gemmatimonadaceae bacterium]
MITPSWPGYDSAFVLDLLATVGPFNVNNMYGRPFTPVMIENARQSGMTGCNATVSASGVGDPSFIETVSNIAFWEREFAAHPDVLCSVRTLADLQEAKRSKRLGVILGFQDGTMFGDDPSRVDLFYHLGVRIVQFTYNGRNLLGDGCLEPANGGLTNFGRACVARMNELGVLIDLSHMGRQTSLDTIHASTKPVAATHTGCTAVADMPRNKPDALLKEIADRGGVVGIYLMPYLRTSGQPHAEDVMRHIEHALNICGEDHVGIGSDNSITPIELTPEFRQAHAESIRTRQRLGISAPGETEDVFTYVPEFNAPRRLDLIADALAKNGHPSARIEKIIGGNWMRLLGAVWRANT